MRTLTDCAHVSLNATYMSICEICFHMYLKTHLCSTLHRAHNVEQ